MRRERSSSTKTTMASFETVRPPLPAARQCIPF
jgi:hypothetical protein